ncbi:MAG: AbrB/MazE/SpoVT family DNA-binding domain-containing protein [Thermoanaerobaculales bacterium]|jgi:putative addiction module antidote|nr:AbrB/MazE/SpoVT family DNA-binding domain-containing protein [Thermoanaerobaculales bacterium]
MVKQTKIRRAGGSLSATLPKDMVDRLHLAAGDSVFLVETDRGLLLTPYDPAFEEALDTYRRGAQKFRNALRELAK